MRKQIVRWTVLMASCSLIAAAETFPKEGWVPTPDPIASPLAVQGGTLSIWAGGYPKSFNYFLDQNTATAASFGLMYESLLGANSLTREMEPLLARSWTISDDGKTFAFELDPRARWSDGQPVTAEDVEWTFNIARDPKSMTGQIQSSLKQFDRVEVLSPQTVRFFAKEVSFLNIYHVGGLSILPKHAFETMDFNKINFEFPVVSGSYRVEEIKEGSSMTMSRNPVWWRRDDPSVRGMYNFDRLKQVFYSDRDDAYAAFRKGLFDLYPVYTSHQWNNQTSGEQFEENWVVKQQVFNHPSRMLNGYAMNLKRPVFQDVRVRRAMALLFDRQRMNQTLMYNAYALHRSYFEDAYDAQNPNPHAELRFDPEKAGQLLDEAGWIVNPATGIREKNGTPLAFTFLQRSAVEGKFLAIFNEALVKAGVKMTIDRKDFAAWNRDVDEKNFDMTVAAWGPAYPKNPRNLWASEEADRLASPNYTGFKNDQVDALIKQYDIEFDPEVRQAILRQIDQILVEQSPYILHWYVDSTRLLYWNKFGTPPTVLDKYNDEQAALAYWWQDPDRTEELEEAVKNGMPLPAEPSAIMFDDAFDSESAP